MKKGWLSLFFSCLLTVASAAGAEIPQGSLAVEPRDGAEIRAQKKAYNRAYFTNLSAIACAGAYAPETSEEARYLRYYGWEFVPHTAIERKTMAHFTISRNKRKDGSRMYLVAFRGSADAADVRTDLNVKQVVFGGSTPEEAKKMAETEGGSELPKVHKGFNDFTNAALNVLVDAPDLSPVPPARSPGPGQGLENGTMPASEGVADGQKPEQAAGSGNSLWQLLQQDPQAKLLLTGHSLGGAAAVLMGARLISYGIDPERITVVTFGAPAVGNQAFAGEYAPRLDLVRVTNTGDFIPGSLQTFLGGYKQFGEHVSFHIPATQSNLSHFMTLYLDAAQREYYQAADKAVREKLLPKWPDIRRSDPERPVVAIEVRCSDKLRQRPYAPDLRRFMLNEYKALFPNYTVLRGQEDDTAFSWKNGADYLLILDMEAVTSRQDNSWFLELGQQLTDRDGNTLTVSSTGKRTSPEAGNILAAMEAVRLQRQALLEKLPWLEPAEAASAEKRLP